MTTRADMQVLISYVLGDGNRNLVASSGIEALTSEKRIAALRGLQDLGWIGHGGSADNAESYSLTMEGKRLVHQRPPVESLDQRTRDQIGALRAVDGESNGARKDGLRLLICFECEVGNWDSAIVNCYELRKAGERSKDVTAIAFSHFYQGKAEVAQNRWDDAIESYLGALEEFIESGDRKGVGETNCAMGVVYGNKGDHSSARRCFESSLDTARSIGDRALETKASGNLAIIYDLEGKTDLAEQAHKTCLDYYLQAKDEVGAAKASNNLGVLCMSRDRFEPAAKYFEQAIVSCRSIKNREVLGAALVNAGYCYAKNGDMTRALGYTDEAISIFKEPNNTNMLALTYRNYGCIELRNSNHEKGFEWFEKSVRAAKASGVEDTMAACCYEYGMCLISCVTNLRLAKKLLSKSCSTYQDIGNSIKATTIRSKLAAV